MNARRQGSPDRAGSLRAAASRIPVSAADSVVCTLACAAGGIPVVSAGATVVYACAAACSAAPLPVSAAVIVTTDCARGCGLDSVVSEIKRSPASRRRVQPDLRARRSGWQ